jgi:hypothetical protein
MQMRNLTQTDLIFHLFERFEQAYRRRFLEQHGSVFWPIADTQTGGQEIH